jgi:hypothetical protein
VFLWPGDDEFAGLEFVDVTYPTPSDDDDFVEGVFTGVVAKSGVDEWFKIAVENAAFAWCRPNPQRKGFWIDKTAPAIVTIEQASSSNRQQFLDEITPAKLRKILGSTK